VLPAAPGGIEDQPQLAPKRERVAFAPGKRLLIGSAARRRPLDHEDAGPNKARIDEETQRHAASADGPLAPRGHRRLEQARLAEPDTGGVLHHVKVVRLAVTRPVLHVLLVGWHPQVRVVHPIALPVAEDHAARRLAALVDRAQSYLGLLQLHDPRWVVVRGGPLYPEEVGRLFALGDVAIDG